MKYYSTNNRELRTDVKSAVIQGLAADKGLFMPESIPILPQSFWTRLPEMSLGEIGYETLKPYFCPDIDEAEFRTLTNEAFNFPIPLRRLSDKISVLELFHGPTLAFKDVGARFLARVMARFTQDHQQDIHVLVATSGDTGSAVANGFLGVKGVRVVVLYPKGLVSDVQEKQFTTLGQNITAIEVDGTFDDSQRLVKTAFMDEGLNKQLHLTSANSINIARFLPQMVYYFHAYAQALKQGIKTPVVCVPSGNFGNLTAGLIASKMGLPIKRFVAATNINDVVPKYLQTGIYQPMASISTPANAMDVGDPSNFIRIQDLFGYRNHDITAMINGQKIDNKAIYSCIKKVYEQCNYILDPHAAIAYEATERNLENEEQGIFLATAHPAKFPATVETIINKKVDQPERLQAYLKGKKKVESASKTYDTFKEMLVQKAMQD